MHLLSGRWLKKVWAGQVGLAPDLQIDPEKGRADKADLSLGLHTVLPLHLQKMPVEVRGGLPPGLQLSVRKVQGEVRVDLHRGLQLNLGRAQGEVRVDLHQSLRLNLRKAQGEVRVDLHRGLELSVRKVRGEVRVDLHRGLQLSLRDLQAKVQAALLPEMRLTFMKVQVDRQVNLQSHPEFVRKKAQNGGRGDLNQGLQHEICFPHLGLQLNKVPLDLPIRPRVGLLGRTRHLPTLGRTRHLPTTLYDLDLPPSLHPVLGGVYLRPATSGRLQTRDLIVKPMADYELRHDQSQGPVRIELLVKKTQHGTALLPLQLDQTVDLAEGRNDIALSSRLQMSLHIVERMATCEFRLDLHRASMSWQGLSIHRHGAPIALRLFRWHRALQL